MVMRSWQRVPSGKALRTLLALKDRLNAVTFREDFLSLTPEEFADALRAERVSEHMIVTETREFQELQVILGDRKVKLQQRRDAAKEREVGPTLSPYEEAERRRSAKGVTDDEP